MVVDSSGRSFSEQKGIVLKFFNAIQEENVKLNTFLTLCQQDMRPMKAGRCQFYTSGNSYIYENYYATVSQALLIYVQLCKIYLYAYL